MKTKKINFMNISNELSRSEMKMIMAGSGPNCWADCTTDSDCAGGDNSCKTCCQSSGLGFHKCVSSC